MAPITQTCAASGKPFLITDDDQAFYGKIGVPLPTLCPEERQRQRLAYRNERKLYKRTCDGTGKTIVCMYPQDTSFPVYSHEYFFSDAWNALDYGVDFDFGKTFFEQFYELQKTVPRMMNFSVGNENAEYGNLSSWNKNCYMCFESDNNRDTFFCDNSFKNINVVDSSYARECEICYECTDIQKCYNLRFCLNCRGCSDSWFLKNCVSCKNCFGCVNLKNKEYCFWNEQLSKEDYENRVEKFDLGSRQTIQTLKAQFLEFAKRFPHKYMSGLMNENCTGDYLNNCKDSQFCFDSSELRDSKFIFNCERIKNGYDIDTYGGEEGSELVYECQSVGRGSFNVAFGNNVYQNLADVWYCDSCIDSHDLFGCISLRNSKYCILNKQYTKDDYLALREEIVKHMKKPLQTQAHANACVEFGEFFPIKFSSFPYNETMAHMNYPLSKEEALARGYTWRDTDKKEFQAGTLELPDTIDSLEETVCNSILACAVTGQNYKLQKAEFTFYKKYNLPAPTIHPDERYRARISLRNPRCLWDRQCGKCGTEIITTYSPGRPESVYCEKCYTETVL